LNGELASKNSEADVQQFSSSRRPPRLT
jgi:hypothetical protein